MLSTGLLTSDDLDEIGCSFRDQPVGVAAELVEAVDQGRMADPADTGYALMLAAELTERVGDLSAAAELAERAMAAYRLHRDSDSYPRSYRAKLLLRLGRVPEAMAELTVLRPLLSRDPDAMSWVVDALESGGHAEVAEQWLTAALRTVLPRPEDSELERPEPLSQQDVAMAFILVRVRHRVRRDLDLPHDDYDFLSDVLMEALREALEDEPDDEGAALLFWPQPEFDQLLLRWPALADHYGHTWDEYRTTLQRTLVAGSESGVPRLGLLTGSVENLVSYAEHHGGDLADPAILTDYAEYLAGQSRQIAWPPGRNYPCWCGSPLKYKKCCLPRART